MPTCFRRTIEIAPSGGWYCCLTPADGVGEPEEFGGVGGFCGVLPMLFRDVESLFADLEVRPIENLGDEVQAIRPESKLDQVGFAILHLVQSGSFLRVCPNVRKLVV